jgi:pyruvate/2-oxoglutarate dehydrogenase complex dihydrolipoamide dehydrogenase (E3) component
MLEKAPGKVCCSYALLSLDRSTTFLVQFYFLIVINVCTFVSNCTCGYLGQTCVVGAGYVALECGGFLAGLKQGDVKVLVRSKPLRTFDQDVVKYVVDYMLHHDMQLVEGVVPSSIEKLPNGRLLVKYGDVAEEFDTVLSAIGRAPDLPGLGLTEAFGAKGIEVARSGKIVATNEQTTVPHVYAIGDVVHDAPELTPVAILAGVYVCVTCLCCCSNAYHSTLEW